VRPHKNQATKLAVTSLGKMYSKKIKI